MSGIGNAKRTGMLFAALIGSALIGCSKQSPPVDPSMSASGAAPISRSDSSEVNHNDPCSLLEPKEVEAVLGAPLATPPFRSVNGPATADTGGDTCIYEAANFRYISLEVDFTDGARSYSTFNMSKNLMKSTGTAQIANNVKKNFKLDDGTEISGEWDEASLMAMSCCIFAGLRGDQLITIDFTASRATLRQAASLVDAAYKRIDHPLRIDGGQGVDAAKAFENTRPKSIEACSLLSRAEVEAILGTLSADPTPGQSGCDYVLPAQGNVHPQYGIQIFWRGGYNRWRSDHHVASIGTGAINQIVTDVNGGRPVPGLATGEADASAAAGDTKSVSSGDPAETIGPGFIAGFTVVKRDVLINVTGSDRAKEQALLAAIAKKI